MQALTAQGQRLSRRHPEARHCIAAYPFVNRSVSSFPDATRRFPLTDSGTSTLVRMRQGWGLFHNSNITTWTSALAFPAFTAGFSWMMQINQDVTGAFPREIFEYGSAIMMTEIARKVSLYNTAGTQIAASTTAITLGLDYSIGVRYVAGTNAVSFFINGVREDFAGAAAIAPTSSIFAQGGGGFRNGWSGNIRDLRIFHAVLPDAAFERYYRDPHSFYATGRTNVLKSAPGGLFGRMFFPFLHPALQS